MQFATTLPLELSSAWKQVLKAAGEPTSGISLLRSPVSDLRLSTSDI